MVNRKVQNLGVLVAFTLCANALFPQSGFSQTEENKVLEGSPVQVYGQTLSPHLIKTLPDEHNWSHVKTLLPSVLPGADSSSKSPEELCDNIASLLNTYLYTYEKTVFELTGEYHEAIKKTLVDKNENELVASGFEVDDSEVDVFISEQLSSPDWEGLFEIMPEKKEAITNLRKLMFNSVMLQFVHDAALKQCPERAVEKRYIPYYICDDLNADYAPELCEAIEASSPSLSDPK